MLYYLGSLDLKRSAAGKAHPEEAPVEARPAIYTYAHTYCIHIHMHVCVYIYIYIYVYIDIYTHVYIEVWGL